MYFCFLLWCSIAALSSLAVLVRGMAAAGGGRRRRLWRYCGMDIGIKLFFDTSDRAGYLFAPTAAWVTVATCLQVFDCCCVLRQCTATHVQEARGCCACMLMAEK